jgi:hypothetical protein
VFDELKVFEDGGTELGSSYFDSVVDKITIDNVQRNGLKY